MYRVSWIFLFSAICYIQRFTCLIVLVFSSWILDFDHYSLFLTTSIIILDNFNWHLLFWLMFYVMRPFWILTLTYFCSVLYRRYVYLFPPSHTPSFKLLYGTAPVTSYHCEIFGHCWHLLPIQTTIPFTMIYVYDMMRMQHVKAGDRDTTGTHMYTTVEWYDMPLHQIRWDRKDAMDGWMDGWVRMIKRCDGTAWDEVQCNGVEWVEGSDCNELPLKINNHTECVYSMIVKTTINDER